MTSDLGAHRVCSPLKAASDTVDQGHQRNRTKELYEIARR
jgi:hypothetical protein